jgi:glutathionylspermidine synthase
MITLLRAAQPLSEPEWLAVRQEMIFSCCKWDIQAGDHCALARFPLLLAVEEWQRLARWAEQLSTEALAAEQELCRRPQLLKRLGLPGCIRNKVPWSQAEGNEDASVRVMRFDFHLTTEGWRLSEVNADVPGGFIEASGFTGRMSQLCACGEAPPDPADVYARAIRRQTGANALVALVHATAHCDDRQVMEYLGGCLRRLGLQTCMVSPAHVTWQQGRARLQCKFASGTPDLLLRFFPAEWLPNLGGARQWSPYFCGGATRVSNPASALLIQSKRFPLVWNELDTSLAAWRGLMPETRCPREVARLWSGEWVVKPTLGREGEDVAIPGVTPAREVRAIRRGARWYARDWVAQRRFHALPLETPEGLRYPCLGVFTVDGQAAGLYGRMAEKPLIGCDAQDVAVLLQDGKKKL